MLTLPQINLIEHLPDGERDGKSLAPYQIAFGATEAVIVSHKINRLGHGVSKHVILSAKP